jgi:inner membrane transporter RhtA
MYALRHLPRQTFSTMLSLEPLVGAMAGWLFLSESLHLSQVVAMGAIVLACVGSASMVGNTQAASEKG